MGSYWVSEWLTEVELNLTGPIAAKEAKKVLQGPNLAYWGLEGLLKAEGVKRVSGCSNTTTVLNHRTRDLLRA